VPNVSLGAGQGLPPEIGEPPAGKSPDPLDEKFPLSSNERAEMSSVDDGYFGMTFCVQHQHERKVGARA
jgi:hypothetical protein